MNYVSKISILSLFITLIVGINTTQAWAEDFTGDQSDGVNVISEFITEVNVKELTGDINPDPGTSGILFYNTDGGAAVLNAGVDGDGITINTAGGDASGIVTESQGTVTGSEYRASLLLLIPEGSSSAGGKVEVNSYSDITTDGDDSHGIVARNKIGGYPSDVIASLEAFNPDNTILVVHSVKNADGTDNQTKVGKEVTGSNGGTIIMNADGTFTVDLGTDFDDLDDNETETTALTYQVSQTSAGGSDLAEGHLTVKVSRNIDSGELEEEYEIYFSEYNVHSKSEDMDSLFPDLQGYVNNLLADAGISGPGESIDITNYGIIETKGDRSHGIFAETESGNGYTGSGGSIWHSSGAGGPGDNGGAIKVVHEGTIITGGNESSGIVARSLGGRGGRGGNGGAWRYGARGGKGGNGGDITISGSGSIHTTGAKSYGILGISEGGVGGNGGSGTASTGGGDGWVGGDAGLVTINGSWEITTEKDDSYGIWGKSIGGGGGKGGADGWWGTGGAGGGGEGSDGGKVEITSSGTIDTLGKSSYGIYAQSVGGFGGDGGTSSALFVSFGGHGNSAGIGGEVTVTNEETGTITTSGVGSHAIFGQSIGGGGGSGGSAGGLVALGGEAGAGGHGGTVNITNKGQITTDNDTSRGIYAQSIGGGGGDGGASTGMVSIGGDGGAASDGGNVVVTNTGNISTGGTAGGAGDDSTAVFLQSIGGGGGNGGASTAIGLGVSVGIGGTGAGGGTGGTVTYNAIDDVNDLTATTIETTGDRSHGIQAQSVGGGGGNGGAAISTTVGGGFSAGFALGGDGAGGGDSGEVIVNEKGDVLTAGEQSIGIFAQSIGGGGGNGGGSVAAAAGGVYNLSLAIGGLGGKGGASDSVTVNTVGNISTIGKLSHGIMAQSVGGGGGNGGYSIAASFGGGLAGTVALGGKAGTGNTGSSVNVTATGADFVDPTISTQGEGAIGILAQSVGGGGGNGGLAGTLSAGGGAFGVSLGGEGGAGSSGGAVSVTNENKITTAGNNASAIFAQSVGGGGGNGGAALSGTGGVIGASVALGGSGGAGSNGDEVYVNNSGSITTGNEIDPNQEFGNFSSGIFAQSVGGGGGNGGLAISGAVGVSVENIPGGAAAISIGGEGGGASDGGQVTVDNSGSIQSYGLGAHAIFAQSVGGGGGNGGLAGSFAMTLGNGAAFGVAVGGGGSGGGDAGAVIVNNMNTAASIITRSDGADGIHAQSIGGGGGDGGFAMSGAFGFGGETSVNVAVAIGGEGGEGGIGNNTTVTSHSDITTYGHNANGVMAQSVGGGGGNGGMAVTGTLAFAETAGAVGVSVGGAGGIGSIGKTATVDNYGKITTWGNDAIGILAQSIGGSGGNGGLSVAAQMTGSTKKAATVGVSIGGGAGDGNYGGEVEVTNHTSGSISTNGLGAHGIKAQSIGGGGGNGGMAIVAQLGIAGGTEDQASKSLNVDASVGGKGGVGGYGNTVHVINDGEITVSGAAATGIFSQSVGGGGGDGGGAVSAIGMLTDSANSDSRSMVISVTVGGKGGEGNFGGNVTVDNTGSVVTEGVSGYGVFAQSIGGGGGIGGRANTIQMLVTKPVEVDDEILTNKNSIQLGATIGGNGGTGGDGGNVIVNNEGTVETWEEISDGIYAQSVGAGGGNGGNGILGSGELLPIPGGTAVLEKALGLFGLKGAVKTYKNIQVNVGGSTGATGNGGTVEVNNNKNITTHGSNSNGIFAQSIGGGGGVGGKAVIGATGTLGLGGEGGSAGNGEKVTVNQYDGATIETFGVASNGIFAQSVGGGGGIAGNVDRALAADIETPISGLTIPGLNLGVGLALGRSGGNGGNGGVVDVDVDGQIITHGDSAAGIFAQSVGGGGGVLGELGNDLPALDLLSWQIGSAGDAGDAGEVDVNLTGSIKTTGNNATGIFAQSAGGTGNADEVKVTLDGSIETGAIFNAGDGTTDAPLRGLGSIGILAQSAAVNNDNNGDITIDINSANGFVRGGRSQIVDADSEYIGVGIWVIDGKNNSITNKGLITTLGGIDNGFAILATGSDATHLGGNENVINYGTITGNISLGAGTNAFNNQQDATINTGTTFDLGTGDLTNNGTLSPGGNDNVFTTEITGNLVQSSSGTFSVDIDTSIGMADYLNISGTADLAGVADLNIVNPGWAVPGTHLNTIVKAAGSTTDSGLSLKYRPSIVIDYNLSYPNPTDVVLSTSIDFSPSQALGRNQGAVGKAINTILLAGGSDSLAPFVLELLEMSSLAELAAAYDDMSPATYDIMTSATIDLTSQYTQTLIKRMHSLRSFIESLDRDMNYSQTKEYGWWTEAFGQWATQDSHRDSTGYEADTKGIAFGLDNLLSDKIIVGISVGTSKADIDLKRNQGDGDIRSYFGSAYASYFTDRMYVDGVLSFGLQDYDNMRRTNIGSISNNISSSHDGESYAAYIESGCMLEAGAWAFQPFMALGYTYLDEEGYDEHGANGINLSIDGRKTDSLISDLGARMAYPFKAKTWLCIPEATLAWHHDFDIDSRNIVASFDSAPNIKFKSSGEDYDKDGFILGAALTLISKNAISLSINYTGDIRSSYYSHSLTGGIRYEF